MPQDERTLITRADIYKDLKKQASGNVPVAVFLGLLLGFLSGLLTVILCTALKKTDIGFMKWAAYGLIALCWATVILVVLLTGLPNRKRIRMLEAGEFSIVTDTLTEISLDETAQMNRRRIRLEDAFYFARYGRVVVDRHLCHMSAPGEVFHLVVLHDPKRSVMRVYHPLLYRFLENEVRTMPPESPTGASVGHPNQE